MRRDCRFAGSFVIPTTCSGDKYHVNYSPSIGINGEVVLTESSKDDIQQLINSFASSCDFNFILDRLKVGITSDFRPVSDLSYGDFTVVPNNFSDTLNLISKARTSFDSLSVDIKSKFDFDLNKWLCSAGSKSWLSDMCLDPIESTVNPAVEPTVNKVV